MAAKRNIHPNQAIPQRKGEQKHSFKSVRDGREPGSVATIPSDLSKRRMTCVKQE